MHAEILSVGTELLLGEILNTNAQYLSRELAAMGIPLHRVTTLGDNFSRIVEFVQAAGQRCDLLIATGGLGPTEDDLTKEAFTQAFGTPLVLYSSCLQSIEEYFNWRGIKMSENNRKQAYLPEGATVFPNLNGTAPGCSWKVGGMQMILLPGPPKEMKPMFETFVAPFLKQGLEGVIFSQNVHSSGIGESAAADLVSDLLAGSNPTVAPYASVGDVRFRVTAKADSMEQARAMCAPVVAEIQKRLGSAVYGVDCGDLQSEVVRRLASKGLKLTTAESCTGGWIAKRITDVPGSSDVFECGVVSYANDVKHRLLGVSPQTLEQYGAVSEQTALEMAQGALRLAHADLAVSATGIAGPSGETPQKPIGLAYIAVTDGSRHFVRQILASHEQGRRDYNRLFVSAAALKLVYDYLSGSLSLSSQETFND